jgi:caffeoyl-CoA O-methyltransferase
VADRHFQASPYADRIRLVVGDARETIGRLDEQFDLVYIDAWKVDYPDYFDLVLPMLAPRGMIVADNVLYGGRVLDPCDDNRGAVAMRTFAQQVASDARVNNVLLTVGDGLMLAWRSALSEPAPQG